MNSEQLHHWCEQQAASTAKQQWSKPLIMGILNITPDSFSDGGCYLSLDEACRKAEHMIAHGADIIDIGGESTRPGAASVSVEEELSRVIPVIERLRQMTDHCLSIDTSKPDVMKMAVLSGASMINDVYALRQENALETAADLAVPVCLMHMQGRPETMQDHPYYPGGVLDDIKRFFSERISACTAKGIKKSRLILDPGFGFGKKPVENLQLMNKLQEMQYFELPLLLGVSRKSTLGALLDKNVDERMIGGLAMAIYAAFQGVRMIRTHDVDETHQAFNIIDAIQNV